MNQLVDEYMNEERATGAHARKYTFFLPPQTTLLEEHLHHEMITRQSHSNVKW